MSNKLYYLAKQIRLDPAPGWSWVYRVGIGYVLEETCLKSKNKHSTLNSHNNNGGDIRVSTSLGTIR